MKRDRLSYYAHTAPGYNNQLPRPGALSKSIEVHRKIVNAKKKREELEQAKLKKKYENFVVHDRNQKAKKVFPPNFKEQI